MTRARRLQFDWQIWPWLLSALIGWLIAFNTPVATIQLALVILGVALYLIFYNLPDERGLRLILAGLPSIVAVIFVLTSDGSHASSKLPFLDPIMQWFAAWPGKLGIALNSNVAGGIIAVFIPLQAWALRTAQRSTQALLIGISLIGLVLSVSRGAWLAFGLMLAVWIAWHFLKRRRVNWRRVRLIGVSAVLIGAVLVTTALIFIPLGERLLQLGGGRPAIWHNSVNLVGDYPFTGIGFAGFEMVYSSYALLVHVGHTFHAHNLWLDIWLDQGLLGIAAAAGLVLNAVWPRPNASHWRWAALASLSVMLIHGLFDDAFYGYGGAAMPLLLIPMALAARPNEIKLDAPGTFAADRRFQPALLVWAVACGLVIITLILPRGRAMWEANLGAVDQTRAELSIYRWPDVPIQDALRRLDGVNLSSAIQHYETALLLDSRNASANRRYGQVELARGESASACARLQIAYAAQPDWRATRQLYGECLALNGQIDQAAELWRTIDLSQRQIDLRIWWYESYRGEAEQAMTLRRALAESKQN